jgi:hypothetical protein
MARGLDYIQVMQEQVRMKRGYLHERSEGA